MADLFEKIKKGKKCLIIAEAGVNHNGKLSLAKKLIDEAKKVGADAVKFQTFKAEDLVTHDAKTAEYQARNTRIKESQIKMLKKLELRYDDFKELKKYCDKKNILFLSTPYTESVVDFLDQLVNIYKVSSADLTNLSLLKKIAKKKKPIILSTGMANIDEIKEAVDVIKKNKNEEIILLHCTADYPPSFDDVNLRAMETMKKSFPFPIGYSDHTEGIEVSLAAVALGASVIEKHITLDKQLPGPDNTSSLEPKEFADLVKGIRNIERALGSPIKKPSKSELKIAKVGRKSIVSLKDIGKGEKISLGDLAIKRPGTGIAPKYLDNIIGKIAKRNIKKDSLIKKADFI